MLSEEKKWQLLEEAEKEVDEAGVLLDGKDPEGALEKLKHATRIIAKLR